jgi:hypothetical protein
MNGKEELSPSELLKIPVIRESLVKLAEYLDCIKKEKQKRILEAK